MTDDSVFAAALAIPSPSARSAFLEHACAGKPGLRKEVEELLSAHAADNPLDRPPINLARTGAYEPEGEGPPAAEVGDRIGPYRLMEQIGEGGFGLVFVAEQSEPIRRKVALKVLKPGMDTRDVVARFEAERQALALMDHPNIAKVLDAGSTSTGRPFFVMELVRGVPITEFCDQHKLLPRERLDLFVNVCQAVQHAHQKGVIHRDLKPSNILVTMIDGSPVPKVIDFGVAKAVGQSLTEKTVYTRFAQMIGTPLYMSPEQAEMSGVDVDTRSDVYALGVLLYELLTGSTPFDRDRFRKAAFDEIRRIIREEEPPRPSTRLTSLGATLTAVSANRKTDPGKLAGLVRGDLDWIVMKCLEKDRNRRYETAIGLARDVQRYLAGDAVDACPPTLGYRLRKALRRNRAAVLVGSVFALILMAASGVGIAFGLKAKDAEAAARENAKAAEEKEQDAFYNAGLADTRLRTLEVKTAELKQLATDQRRTLYDSSMNLAQAAWDIGDTGRTFELIRREVPAPGEEDLRGFEWHYWNRMAHLDKKTVQIPGFVQSDVRAAGALSPDGTRVFGMVTDVVHDRKEVKLWETHSGRELWTTPLPSAIDYLGYTGFSQDGRRVSATRYFLGQGERTRDNNSEVLVWDTASGANIYTTHEPEGKRTIRNALFKDGSLLACTVQVTKNPTNISYYLIVRQLPDGKEVFRYPPDETKIVVGFIAFSPDGKRLAAIVREPGSNTRNSLVVWKIATGWEMSKCDFSELPLSSDLFWSVSDLQFSPDGQQLVLAIGDETTSKVIVLDSAALAIQRTFSVPAVSNNYLNRPILSFDETGNRLAVALKSQVYLCSIDPKLKSSSEPIVRTLRGHEFGVRSMVFERGGNVLVTLDGGGIVKYWDLASSEKQLQKSFGSLGYQLRNAGVMANCDGSRVAIVSQDVVPRLRLRDLNSKELANVPLPSSGHLDDLIFSKDGRKLVLSWHDMSKGQFDFFVWDAISGREIKRFTLTDVYTSIPALSTDGNYLVATTIFNSPGARGRSDASIVVWETSSGKTVFSRRDMSGNTNFFAAFSPDGRWIAITPLAETNNHSRLIFLDAQTGKETASLEVGNASLAHPEFSGDGQYLMAAKTSGETATFPVWEVAPILRGEAPSPRVTISGQNRLFVRSCFSPDGRRILTCGGGLVKLWDAASGIEVLNLKSNGAATGEAFFSPDGNKIWAGLDEHGHLWGWDGTPIAEAKKP